MYRSHAARIRRQILYRGRVGRAAAESKVEEVSRALSYDACGVRVPNAQAETVVVSEAVVWAQLSSLPEVLN